MKKVMKSAVVAFALALSLSLGVGVTADAAKVTVKKVTSVDKLTGKGNKKSNRITLAKGKKATLKTTVTVTPNTSANEKVTYKTSNKKIATVSSKGVITAKKVGTATITVKSKKNKKKTAKVYVKVVKGYVKKVTVKPTTAELEVKGTQTIKATVKTKGKNPNKTLKWTSSDPIVATVSSKGVITALTPGVATITAQSTDGTNQKATVKVLVKGTTIKLAEGKDIKATVTFAKDGKALDDFNSIVAAANLSDETEVELTIDNKKVKKSVKAARDYLTKNGNKKTSVTVTIAAAEAKKYGIVAALLAPLSSVDTVEVEGFKFSAVTADSFKMGDKTYNYHLGATSDTIVLDGHVAADFEKFTVITAVNNSL